MSNMRKSILTVFLFILCSFRISPLNEADNQVMKIADSQMGTYLAKIEPGDEAKYGFTDKDDLDGCVVGRPYRIIEFNRDFYNNALTDNTSYIDIKNKWLVPISLNHQYKAMLTVTGNPGNLQVTSMGEVALAKEIQLMSVDADENDELYLLKVPALSTDFYVHEGNNSFSEAKFIPLENAEKAIPSLSASKEYYTLAEIQVIIKGAVEKQGKK